MAKVTQVPYNGKKISYIRISWPKEIMIPTFIKFVNPRALVKKHKNKKSSREV